MTPRFTRSSRLVGAVGLAGVLAMALTGCNRSTLDRPSQPVVLTGADISPLVGVDPDRVVAFRHSLEGSTPTWTQIPVQVDERKVVPFGSQPSNNTSAGVVGTVYGNGSGGPTALQYADAGTFVGADADPLVDANDEIVFMAFDAGGKPKAEQATEPAGAVPGSGTAIFVNDARGSNEWGWVYLFESDGSLDPSAGQDYVDYDFELASGPYLTTYKRADGPNLETSSVVTDTYEIGYTDRWKETSWRVLADDATGVDILDGHKNQFATTTCGRSNRTFAGAEGAFVANTDGPIRGIRSYIGANSGPLTQRTHLMYRDRTDVITDLRVHAIPGIIDFIDYSAAAVGITYRSSTLPGGVTIDGASDAVGSAVPSWEAVDGPQGTVYTRNTFTSSQSSLASGTVHFYRDQTTPTEQQCWGDGSYYGASGAWIATGINNTDPRNPPFQALQGLRVTEFSSPEATPADIPTDAADWADDLATPLVVTVTDYTP